MEKISLKAPSSFDPNSFDLTDSALEHFTRSLEERSSGIGVRFSVSESSGCSGYPYSLDYVDSSLEEDLVFDFSSLKVFIDPTSFNFLKGTKVDFSMEGVNQGVKFLNPNVKAVCGCGESFEVDI